MWESGNRAIFDRAIGDRQWNGNLEIANLPLPFHCQLQIAGTTLPDCPIPTLPMNREPRCE